MVGTSPLVFRHGTIGYANLALGFYLFVAVTMLIEAIHRPHTGPGISILSGIFFFAACWVRPEGWALAGLGIGIVLFISIFKRQKEVYLQFAYPASALVVYGIFWVWVKNTVYGPLFNKTSIFSSALSGILGGEFHIREALYVLKYFFLDLVDVQTWGFLGIGFLLIAISAFVIAISKNQKIAIAQWVGIAYVLAIMFMYYIVSYDTGHDISWWASTGLARMMLPGILLSWEF